MYVFAHLLFFSDAVPCADSRENHSFPIAPIEPAWSRRGALRSASPLRSPVFQPSPRTGNSGFALPVAEEAKPEFSAAVENPEDQRKPDGIFGNCKVDRWREAPDEVPAKQMTDEVPSLGNPAVGATCGRLLLPSPCQATKGRPKLSTKCRQLEPPKWKLPKKFPFWHRLNVKGGIPSPSPLHNPPMRVQALPYRFVYSLPYDSQNFFQNPVDKTV